MKEDKDILSFWKENKIFEKSVEQRKSKKNFVFFEGPPTANGKPGVHHIESRAFKDAILRYKTMRGYHAPRRAGWDTHGLPVEVEVEKELGIRSKKGIEEFGIAAFNKKCRESVWRYKELWERMTERMGFWIDMENPYITYKNSYIESLWAIIKEFAKKKLLYEDYKVMPWCARCGTALSSHELAQGYERVKEESIYVKFQNSNSKTYFLVWTTTPWTLPGNVALAVNPEVDYVFAKKEEEILVLAEALLGKIGEGYEIIKKVKGKELVGAEYKPLSRAESFKFQVVAADFVSTEEGTGIVHIAPAFGDDDFKLSQKCNLPVLLSTDENGNMNTAGYPWHNTFFKKANKLIIDDLSSRELLFKSEAYEHDYPFCWRCRTPLMYLARKTWWVDVNKVREKLLKNNETVNWHPEHIKHGRFGGWLREEKNWAFSRERFWGTPLPVWKCAKCKKWEAIGSVDELVKRAPNSGNRYILMRHGEAESNIKHVTNASLLHNTYNLTEKGEKEAQKAAGKFKKQKIRPDFILASPFLRTKRTAEIVARELGMKPKEVRYDIRLAEINTGVFAEGSTEKYHRFYKNRLEKFTKKPPQGETLEDLKQRIWKVIEETEAKYKNMTILIVSHEYPIWMLWASFLGKTNEKAVGEKEKRGEDFVRTAEFMDMKFPNIPRDENLVLDLHKPYIDGIKFACKCGGETQRVKEVVDVWFDAGAMPFAQVHWPFAKSQITNLPDQQAGHKSQKLEYPADYIVEAVDQTRGWFYTLLAVGTLLGKYAPYKNVISLGHVLDKNGKKMSKSLGNIVEPMELLEKYGADSARWYFFTVNQPWDPKLFKEDDVKDARRRFFNILQNVVQFWKMYAEKDETHPQKRGKSSFLSPSLIKGGGLRGRVTLLINRWVLARLNEVSADITRKLDAYDIVGAARELENFVTEDISRWYVRRIRDVMKENSKASKETAEVLRFLLLEISKLLAPFAPFAAENIYKELGGGKDSVHLEDWIKLGKADQDLLEGMKLVRTFAVIALKIRSERNIRVRQPLKSFSIAHKEIKYWKELSEILKDEINVKEIILKKDKEPQGVLFEFDAEITPELREEGILRDLIREIQAARKSAGLMPKDKVSVSLAAPQSLLDVARKNEAGLKPETNTKSFIFSPADGISIKFKK